MEQRISLERMEEAVSLFGSFDENIRILENEFHVSVVNREEQLIINGEPEDTMLAEKAIEALLRLISRGENVGEQHVRYVIGLCRSGQLDRIDELTRDVVCISAKGRPIKPKTIGQKDYIKTIQACPVTIGVGPAGTGKTYLAVAAAVAAFREKEVSRIILTRPAVEAGERLGFLPGDLQSKVDPYLRPLYDALFDMLDLSEVFGKGQHRGGAPGLYAGAYPGRQLYHSGRGPEYQPGADENVPDQNGLRVQGSHHRRCDPDRPAQRQAQRPEGGHAGTGRRGGSGHLPPHPKRCGAAHYGAADH